MGRRPRSLPHPFMHFRVTHRTTYHYERPVRLGPHHLRLHPRADAGVVLLDHGLNVVPEPAARWQGLDPDGNLVTRLLFEGETTRLTIESRFALRTSADPAALPAGDHPPREPPYGPALRRRLAPWLDPGEGLTPAVRELAAGLARQAGDGPAFLEELNRHLHHHLEREIREGGAPHPPEETLRRGRGACRDLAELFLAVARCRGWAGRFVSGVQARGHPGAARRYLHAWPEVYVPEAGWRGFDPTHGRPVGDGHVALAAAARPADAAPIEGSYFGAAASRLEASLSIEARDDAGPPAAGPMARPGSP
ncbi:MAG: transglutaminase family protein [Synechococcaceae cyanobacterium]|nr:transglutaminase family protein [Synechococcaceae cyanobacterium]